MATTLLQQIEDEFDRDVVRLNKACSSIKVDRAVVDLKHCRGSRGSHKRKTLGAEFVPRVFHSSW